MPPAIYMPLMQKQVSCYGKQRINLDSYPYLTEGLTTDNGIVYAGIGVGLSAYDLKTGRILWTNKDWRQREGSTTTLTITDGVLISGTQWGGLYGNDIHTGKQLWKLSEQRTRQSWRVSGFTKTAIMDYLFQKPVYHRA